MLLLVTCNPHNHYVYGYSPELHCSACGDSVSRVTMILLAILFNAVVIFSVSRRSHYVDQSLLCRLRIALAAFQISSAAMYVARDLHPEFLNTMFKEVSTNTFVLYQLIPRMICGQYIDSENIREPFLLTLILVCAASLFLLLGLFVLLFCRLPTRFIPVFSISSFLFYPTICMTIALLFSCNESGNLSPTTDVQCWSKEHAISVQRYGIPLILFAIGIPILIAMHCYVYAGKLEPDPWAFFTAGLYRNWHSFLGFLRQGIFMIFGAFIIQRKDTSSSALILLLVFFVVCEVITSVYSCPQLTRYAFLANLSNLLVYLCAHTHTSYADNRQFLAMIVSFFLTLLLLSNAVIVAYLVYLLFQHPSSLDEIEEVENLDESSHKVSIRNHSSFTSPKQRRNLPKY